MPQVRERDRYARASLREQAGDVLAELRRHPGIVLVLAIVLGGWLVLQLTRPTVVSVGALQDGDCLYIHAADADAMDPAKRPAGSESGAIEALYLAGAERAPCNGSHSHEVARQLRFEDAPDTAYPGAGVLRDRNLDACAAAFTAYVGRAPDGSRYDVAVAVPSEATWTAGERTAPCLVYQRDGDFMQAPARGSGA